ncbi:MAG: cytochrome c4 [Nitrosomonadales bacterium]|nr:cytochrome c4 [Nitrosomonadales bacterium]
MGKKIKFIVWLLLMALSGLGTVHAQDDDFAAGKAKSKLCQQCHGEDGNSINPFCPNLAGQNPAYLEKQIRDFQARVRVDPIMTGVSQSVISDQDVKDIAAYFGSRKRMAGYNANKIGQLIFREGKPESGLDSCASCHGENGRGKQDDAVAFPVLGGQTRDYVIKQLRDMRSGARHNDPAGMMGDIAKKLSDAEISALADYISEL